METKEKPISEKRILFKLIELIQIYSTQVKVILTWIAQKDREEVWSAFKDLQVHQVIEEQALHNKKWEILDYTRKITEITDKMDSIKLEHSVVNKWEVNKWLNKTLLELVPEHSVDTRRIPRIGE